MQETTSREVADRLRAIANAVEANNAPLLFVYMRGADEDAPHVYTLGGETDEIFEEVSEVIDDLTTALCVDGMTPQ